MKVYMQLVFLIICLLITVAKSNSVSQVLPNEHGSYINHVSGPGSRANTYSKSTTEVTTADGRTIVSDSSELYKSYRFHVI